jgi:transposase
MEHLGEISVAELQAALGEVDHKKPTQRLLAAIAYKNGVTQTELSEWYDVERRTIYSWLTRFEEATSLVDAATDAPRPGRNRKLSATQQAQFERTVHRPPGEVGYDEPQWTPALVQRHLAATFDVDYSLPSCRRLLKEAGFQYETAPLTAEGSSAETERRGGRWTPR